MDLETKFKKETGFDAYADNDLRPKVPSDYYVEWLEEQLTIPDVSHQRELLYALADELDVATGRPTPPSMKTLLINKILGI